MFTRICEQAWTRTKKASVMKLPIAAMVSDRDAVFLSDRLGFVDIIFSVEANQTEFDLPHRFELDTFIKFHS